MKAQHLTPQEMLQADRILERVGGKVDLADRRLSREEAVLLCMHVEGVMRELAEWHVAFSRRDIGGDVVY